jgi:hypothetical protein
MALKVAQAKFSERRKKKFRRIFLLFSPDKIQNMQAAVDELKAKSTELIKRIDGLEIKLKESEGLKEKLPGQAKRSKISKSKDNHGR